MGMVRSDALSVTAQCEQEVANKAVRKMQDAPTRAPNAPCHRREPSVSDTARTKEEKRATALLGKQSVPLIVVSPIWRFEIYIPASQRDIYIVRFPPFFVKAKVENIAFGDASPMKGRPDRLGAQPRTI